MRRLAMSCAVRLRWWAFSCYAAAVADTGNQANRTEHCVDAISCQAHVDDLVRRLGDLKGEMRQKQATLTALEDIRTGVLTGKRVEMLSAQRQHLERGSLAISEVTFDARHRPVSTNVSRHFRPLLTIADTAEVVHHAFVALKKSTSGKVGSSTLLVTVDSLSTLSVHDFEGDVLLRNFDLGHGDARQVSHLALSSGSDTHSIVTADDSGVVRVHDLKIVAPKEKKTDRDAGTVSGAQDTSKRQMQASANFSASFFLPESSSGEPRRLTAVSPVDRSGQPWFVVGDSAGGISVFFRNGTLKGRVKVTDDPGGIRGFMRSQGQTIVYFSSHSFGYFSASQIEVQHPPCTGWNSPLVDIVPDPTNAASRTILALEDGDIIVYTTSSGKVKACDLTLKFPRVSSLPFKLHTFRGHVMALPTPLPDSPAKVLEAPREVFVFHVPAMDAGYGLAPSRALVLLASFRPKQPVKMTVAVGASGNAQDRSKGHVAISYAGVKGVELLELNLKQPTPPRAATGGESGGDSWISWLDWFPKIGIFGIALIGVVFWNIRKVANQQPRAGGVSGGVAGLRGKGGFSPDDFDEDSFRERLRERREKRAAEQSMEAAGDHDLRFDDATILSH